MDVSGCFRFCFLRFLASGLATGKVLAGAVGVGATAVGSVCAAWLCCFSGVLVRDLAGGARG